MSEFISNIKDEKKFISELQFFVDYFNNQKANPGLDEAKKIINQIKQIVISHEALRYNQKEFTNTRNVEEWQEGMKFLNSEMGNRFIHLLHYFANNYETKSNK